MSMNRQNNTSTPCSTSTPTQNQSSNQTSENQDDNQWPRLLIMEAADKKYTTELKCIRAEKSNRWNGKYWPWQCQTNEIRQRLYWSRYKTAMQKSLEDNQAPGLFTCESVTTQNPKFIIICHKMWGNWIQWKKMKSKKNFSHKESLLSKQSPYVTVCTF